MGASNVIFEQGQDGIANNGEPGEQKHLFDDEKRLVVAE
jgi:hypothetical protein